MDENFVDAMLQTIVMFQKGYQTFKTENKGLSNEEVMALTDIWWRGLMGALARNSVNKGEIDGFNN